ncbi:MAG: magnesium transporter [Flavobacteriales bacterium]|nr:magnesium transporter [Flavobacteriales bacterium]MCB9449180.1 magnesium transporter [Flavobacteriales bacterium]
MAFELTKEFLAAIEDAIGQADKSRIRELTESLHPADIAEIVEELDVQEAKFLYQSLEKELAAEVIIEMDEAEKEDFLDQFTSREIAEDVIDNLESDDAADLMALLPEEKKQEVLTHMEDVEQASDIVHLMGYDEDTAGGLMAKELVMARESWDIETCVAEMRRQAKEVDDVYAVYVVDDQDRLLGLLSLRDMIIRPSITKVADACNREIISVSAETKAEEVANIMKKYDLVVLPVVNDQQQLIGRITIDDVVDVMQEEAEKDYQLASGISGNVDQRDKAWMLWQARLPWLLIGLVGELVSAKVIGAHESQLQINPQLAFFIPLIAAMGGNAGVQSSAIIVQGLANKSLQFISLFGKLSKELIVALVNGFFCSAILLIYNYLFTEDLTLSLTVGIALIAVIIMASIMGTLVPLILHKYKVDPALATGPFITTTNDVMGMLVYFSIGHLMYSL